MEGGGGDKGQEGRGYCGCLASISSKEESVIGARPSEVRDWMPFLYWPAWVASLARLALIVELRWNNSMYIYAMLPDSIPKN